MGETSATLLQALSQGKPCIVTDDGWFSEIPDACVVKVKPGDDESERLAEVLRELSDDAVLRGKLGGNAQEYVHRNYSPEKVAQDYVQMVGEVRAQQPRLVGSVATDWQQTDGPLASESEQAWVQDYLISRTLKALPTSDR